MAGKQIVFSEEARRKLQVGMDKLAKAVITTLGPKGRNDWASTLPKGNNSYFYPSFNLGFAFSELINLSNKGQRKFSFGKIRASYDRGWQQ